jgi:ParB family transcriptional regulator, chromosome partitioning protein
LGWTHIEASIAHLDALHTRLAEIDENLIRNELTELEQSLQIAERKEIYEAIHPETGHGGDRKSKKKSSAHDGHLKTKSFVKDTVTKTKKSRQVIQRKAKIGKALSSVADKLKGTAIEDNQKELLKLAGMKQQEREQAVERIAKGEAKNVRQAKIVGQAEAIKHEPPPFPQGPFRVITIDPPWTYDHRAEDATHRAAHPSPSLTLAALHALPPLCSPLSHSGWWPQLLREGEGA